jgi:hypothetical protein
MSTLEIDAGTGTTRDGSMAGEKLADHEMRYVFIGPVLSSLGQSFILCCLDVEAVMQEGDY